MGKKGKSPNKEEIETGGKILMENTNKKQIFYRGFLKSCNYSCDYCPFSKHVSKGELEEDVIRLKRFVEFVKQETQVGAVQIVPYGEALIHEYYWKAMAAISRLLHIEMVGCQTNLSFSVEKMFQVFKTEGGWKEKIRLWCTFHPTMVSVEHFLHQCKLLEEKQVSFCVGSVGVPEQREKIRQLREMLSEDIYLWVNPMDGLKRPYTEEEIVEFVKIDPFFPYLLKHTKANPKQCRGCLGETLFVHSNGDITPCNISKKKQGNIYQSYHLKETVEIEDCGRRECSCYLAYSNRLDKIELACYGKYPMFRMGKVPQAMFFDVDGTIVKEENGKLDMQVVEEITYWSQYAKIYLATSLPFPYAMKKCHAIKHILSGGVFANGGMICLFQEKKTWSIAMKQEILEMVLQLLEQFSVKVKIYQWEEKVYKVTGIGRRTIQAYDILKKHLTDMGEDVALTVVLEGEYLEITDGRASKLTGVQQICEYCDYQMDKVMTVGDSENDREMLEFFPMSFLKSSR